MNRITIIASFLILTTGSWSSVAAQKSDSQRNDQTRQDRMIRLIESIVRDKNSRRGGMISGNRGENKQEIEIEVRRKKRSPESSDRDNRGRRSKRGDRESNSARSGHGEKSQRGRRGHRARNEGKSQRSERSGRRSRQGSRSGSDSRSRDEHREGSRHGDGDRRTRSDQSRTEEKRSKEKRSKEKRSKEKRSKEKRSKEKRSSNRRSSKGRTRPKASDERHRGDRSSRTGTQDHSRSLKDLERRLVELEKGIKTAHEKQSKRIDRLENAIKKLLSKK